MNKASCLTLAALTLGMAILTGCAETAGTSLVTRHDDGQTILYEGSTRMKHAVEVTAVSYDKINGLNRVHISLSSKRHSPLRLQYRIAWFDANGMEIDPQSRAYHTLLLQGLDTVTVTGVATSPACVTSRLRVREEDSVAF
jgi:uncharacterized protein YcfL